MAASAAIACHEYWQWHRRHPTAACCADWTIVCCLHGYALTAAASMLRHNERDRSRACLHIERRSAMAASSSIASGGLSRRKFLERLGLDGGRRAARRRPRPADARLGRRRRLRPDRLRSAAAGQAAASDGRRVVSAAAAAGHAAAAQREEDARPARPP